jgi:uncharacterized protein (TIGR03083 family)
MDLNLTDLLQVAFDATQDEPGDLPAELGERVITQSLDARQPRHPGWGRRAGLNSLDAFAQTAAELSALLDTITPEEINQLTRVDGATVADVIEHLVGVERYVLGQLARGPALDAPRREDHWPIAKHAANTSQSDGRTAASVWWQEALQVMAACGQVGPDHPVDYHHLSGTVAGLLVVRTFEIWTHGDDINVGLGRPLHTLDDARLRLMVRQLMDVLPFGLALSGSRQPGRTARFVLYHPDATVDVPLAPGETPGDPDITIAVDVLQLCRLAANRLPREELNAVIDGDARLLEPIMAGATAFAAD